jgi:hypothetical protein
VVFSVRTWRMILACCLAFSARLSKRAAACPCWCSCERAASLRRASTPPEEVPITIVSVYVRPLLVVAWLA